MDSVLNTLHEQEYNVLIETNPYIKLTITQNMRNAFFNSNLDEFIKFWIFIL